MAWTTRAASICAWICAVAACTPFTASPGDDAGPSDAATSGPLTKSPCAEPGHAFCADFDHSNGVEDGWTNLDLKTAPQAAGALDLTMSASPPAAAHLSTSALDCSFAELTKIVPGPFSYAKLAFDVRIGAGRDDFVLAYFALRGSCALSLGMGAAEAAIFQQNDATGSTGSSVMLTHGLPSGQWGRVEVVLDAANRSFSASINGQQVLAPHSLPSVCLTSADIQIGVGPHCLSSGSGLAEVHIDNVVLDAR